VNNNLKELLEVGINKDTFSYVNHGGCGIFAAAMHNSLAAYGILSTIVLVDRTYSEGHVNNLINMMKASDINHAYTTILNNEFDRSIDTCCGHICIKIGDVLYDGEGVYEGKSISGPIHVNVMSRLNRNVNYWNGTFEECNNHYNGGVDDDGAVSLATIIREVNKHVNSTITNVMEG